MLARKRVKVRISEGNVLTLRLYTRDFDFAESILIGQNGIDEDKGEYDSVLKTEPEYVVDGGANIGLFSVLCKMKYPNVKIIALEPEGENYELLVNNTKKYKDIICLNNGVWYRNAFCAVQPSRCAMNENMYSDGAFWIKESEESDKDAKRAFSLDYILNSYKIQKNLLVKLDIEGAEELIFKNGDLEWLNKCDLLVCETHEWLFEGNSMDKDIVKIMKANGYICEISGENKIFRKERDA